MEKGAMVRAHPVPLENRLQYKPRDARHQGHAVSFTFPDLLSLDGDDPGGQSSQGSLCSSRLGCAMSSNAWYISTWLDTNEDGETVGLC